MPPRIFPTCRVCGDRIGMYEPAVVLEPHSERETSLANEPELADTPKTDLAHAGCVAAVHRHSNHQRAA